MAILIYMSGWMYFGRESKTKLDARLFDPLIRVKMITSDQPENFSGDHCVVSVVSRRRCQMAATIAALTSDDSLLGDKRSQLTSVAAILSRCKVPLIANWLTRTKKTPELNQLHLNDKQRTEHLPKLVDDIVARLCAPKLPTRDRDAKLSTAAVEHGKLRRKQGYSSAMLIHESRILQVTIFGTLHENLSQLDYILLLPDVIMIADEVDAQLTQTMDSFAKAAPKSAAYLVKPRV